MTGTRILDITVLSADDLKNARLFYKMNVYAIVSLCGEIQTTSVDRECGRKPVWNQRMRFNVNEAAAMHNNLNVIISLKSNGGCFGGSILGEVCVPVKDMLSQDNGVEERAQSYKITTPGGRTKGTLHIAYKFGPSPSSSPNPGMAYTPPPLPSNHPGGYPTAYSQGEYLPPQGGGYRLPEHAGAAYSPLGVSGYALPPQDHYHHHHSPANSPAYPPPGVYPQPNSAYPPAGGYPPPGQSKPYPVPPGGYAPNVGLQGPTGGFNYPPPPPPGYDNAAMRSAAPGPGPAGYAVPPAVASPPPQQQQKSSIAKKAMARLGLGVGAGVLGGIAAGGLAAAGGMALAGLDSDAGGMAFADNDNAAGGLALADSDMEEED